MRTETFKFNLGDKVIIHEIQRPGIVALLRVTSIGRDYLVDYLNDGTRKSEWLYEWELEPRAGHTTNENQKT